MTFDKGSWHLEAALSHGQPAENAVAHIGLFLAWLVRNDLVNPDELSADLVEGVTTGEMSGSDAVRAVGDGLVADLLTPEGADFTEWYYPRYLDDFAAAFPDEGPYGVADDDIAYARIAPTIDRRYAEWLASVLGGDPPPLSFSADELRGMTAADLDAAAEEIAAAFTPGGGEGDGVGDSSGNRIGGAAAEELRHEARELEALLPPVIDGQPLVIESARADGWGSSLLRTAIENLGADPAECYVAIGLGGTGDDAFAVTLYAIPGVPQDRLEAEFSRDAYLATGNHWQRLEIDGKAVWWSSAEEFDTAFYALGGLVITAGGAPDRVRGALEILP